MNSPRLHLNLPQDAANADLKGDSCFNTSHCVCGVCAMNMGVSQPDLTQTSHALGQKPHTGLPTERGQTSDTAKRRQFEQRLDRLMVRVLLDLSTISQVKAAPTELQAADANAVRLPVGPTGRALTEDPVGQLSKDYKRASLVGDACKRLGLKLDLARQAQNELRSCRYARKSTPDLGTQEGRLAVARYAREHGATRAARAYAQNPEDVRSVESMRRAVYKHLDELAKHEGKR